MFSTIKRRYANATSTFWPTRENWLDQVLLGVALGIAQAGVSYAVLKVIDVYYEDQAMRLRTQLDQEEALVYLYGEPAAGRAWSVPEALMEEADRLLAEEASDARA